MLDASECFVLAKNVLAKQGRRDAHRENPVRNDGPSSTPYLKGLVSRSLQVQTPLEEAKKLSDLTGNRILIKREDMQPVFSFKLRGAYNKVRHYGGACKLKIVLFFMSRPLFRSIMWQAKICEAGDVFKLLSLQSQAIHLKSIQGVP